MSTQCDRETGQCPCKENILDYKCTECKNEHYSFPDCHECHCNLEGAIDNYCNVITGDCVCKTDKIVGEDCDTCKIKTFGYPNCQGMFNCKFQSKSHSLAYLVIKVFLAEN